MKRETFLTLDRVSVLKLAWLARAPYSALGRKLPPKSSRARDAVMEMHCEGLVEILYDERGKAVCFRCAEDGEHIVSLARNVLGDEVVAALAAVRAL